ncbi:acyltransferase [Alteromonas sediminis]|uniref:Acyltransferase n=1 Tax=Alteromonas sediminis TaxID=2259342 RepID=A0A3N5XZU9_9ALTE|nr:acyltransferase [Alteromonas sediminis]RPJ66260.1 acyltransferase [Alteromonas sediminis]
MQVKSALIFVVHTSLQIINLALWALIVFFLGLIKLLIPIALIRKHLLFLMNSAMFAFGIISVRLIKVFNDLDIDYRISDELSEEQWYLLIANHLSYLDIILLIEFSANRIPAPKFFLKRELIWLPFVGIAAWALDMPFMRRFSKAYLEKHPHLRGKDIETTRRSCEKYKDTPTTIINFVEGTRFTTQKHKQKNSPFSHLLPPKAGGIAFTLAAMSNLFTHILDVSLAYPENAQHPMMDMLSGNMKKIIVDVTQLPIPDHVGGDYFNDEGYRSLFQNWLNDIWIAKNERIRAMVNH